MSALHTHVHELVVDGIPEARKLVFSLQLLIPLAKRSNRKMSKVTGQKLIHCIIYYSTVLSSAKTKIKFVNMFSNLM